MVTLSPYPPPPLKSGVASRVLSCHKGRPARDHDEDQKCPKVSKTVISKSGGGKCRFLNAFDTTRHTAPQASRVRIMKNCDRRV